MRSSPAVLRRWGPPAAALLLLSLWAWYRLDLLRPYLDVPLADGGSSRQPNALATVDHPWHAARFSLLLDALRGGGSLRWVDSHQGGFPVEFYPLGSALIDLAVWAVTLGQLPIPLVHTYAVGVTLLLPLIGFIGLAAACRLSLWVGVLAAAAHLSIRGWWWSGGSMELVEWGLVTNVSAAAFLFLALPLAARLLDRWSRPAAGGMAALVGLAILTNPRSAIAIVALGIAIGVSALWHGDPRRIARRLGAPAALALGLASPLLIPLIRYRDLYYFVEYTGYASVDDWVRSSVQAVSGPVVIFTVAGLVVTLRPAVPRAAQLVSLTLVAYALLTVSLIVVPWPGSLVDQLETTRLMPFQRLLMIAVAAIGVGMLTAEYARSWTDRARRDPWLAAQASRLVGPSAPDGSSDGLRAVLDRTPLSAPVQHAALALLSLAVVLLYVETPPGLIPEGDRGLVRIATYADPSIVDLEQAVAIAEAESPPDTAILILGSTVSWHAQLWAPTWSDRRLFYDDWLWYWQREHVGDYDPERAHAYTVDASALDPAFLATHGIGAIVVSGQGAEGEQTTRTAAGAGWLTLRRSGIYDVFAVDRPTPLATIDGQPAAVLSDDGADISISTSGVSGPLVVRTNWFPRWSASIDDRPVATRHRADGYLEVAVPEGSATVRLTYAVTRLDWLGRALAGISGLVVVGLLGSGLRPTARSGPR